MSIDDFGLNRKKKIGVLSVQSCIFASMNGIEFNIKYQKFLSILMFLSEVTIILFGIFALQVFI